ncbi:hypothetical protein [Promicromonospora sukumoe]|uniref:Outer membrane biosynthesis protein TonB n=1 Tax=Promicromonospora sukumoe TaxID=88382 RepID=A0A7W3J638_9MICO|nr:hypothetical protein [Promicromonospora sukumoe]MBA8806854.1 outer membrane biosynthesis protein TonB [Promicromonospora sukumoe]
MSTDALPEQAQAAQATSAGEPAQGTTPQAAPEVTEVATSPDPVASTPAPAVETTPVVAPAPVAASTPAVAPEPVVAPAENPAVAAAPEATPAAAAPTSAPVTPAPAAAPSTGDAPAAPVASETPAPAAAPEADEAPERVENIETRTAARLHELVASGAEKLPGETGSTVSRLAVALLSFGSQAAAKDQDKSTSALVGEAVGLFKSLDDDDPSKQRNALEHALETFTTSTLGGKERSQVLEVAEEAMGLWSKLRGTSSDLAKSDAATSMRSLTSVLRKEGRDEEADEAETEAKRLES